MRPSQSSPRHGARAFFVSAFSTFLAVAGVTASVAPVSDKPIFVVQQAKASSKEIAKFAPVVTGSLIAAPQISHAIKSNRFAKIVPERFGVEATPEEIKLPVAVDKEPAIKLTKQISFPLPQQARDSVQLTLARYDRREALALALREEAVQARRQAILAQRAKNAPALAMAIFNGEVSTETTGNVNAKEPPKESAAAVVTAYAPSTMSKVNEAAFAALIRQPVMASPITQPKWRPKLPARLKSIIRLGRKDHKWAAYPLPRNSYSAAQRRCLAIGVYFEARGEPVQGQRAVAQVILNRVKNPAYPKSICGVVYQNKHMRNACQFSFTCDGIRDKVRSRKHWKTAKRVSNDAIDGKVWLRPVGSSTHYHADYVWPRWRRSMKRLTKIGRHIFYRTYGGGWS